MIIARLCCFVCDLPAFAQRQRHTDDECNGVLFGSLGENQHLPLPPTMIKQLLWLV